MRLGNYRVTFKHQIEAGRTLCILGNDNGQSIGVAILGMRYYQ